MHKHTDVAKMRRQTEQNGTKNGTKQAQMREKNKTPEKELNEMEISTLSGAEFKTLVYKDAQGT